MQVTDLELAVLRAFAEGDDNPHLRALREQIEHLDVVRRDFTGAGFFTKFQVSGPRIPDIPSSTTISDVGADISGTNDGAAFVLWLREGLIDELEGATFDAPWPALIESFRVFHITLPRKLPWT